MYTTAKLYLYDAALADNTKLSTKVKYWYDGVDLKKSILELRAKARRVWDGLNSGLM